MSKCGECKLGCFGRDEYYCEENLGEEQCVARLQEALYDLADGREIGINSAIMLVVKESLREDLPKEITQYLFFDLRHKMWSLGDEQPSKWIETSEGTICSNCRQYPYDDGEYHLANWHSEFCPHCGKRMLGEDDE